MQHFLILHTNDIHGRSEGFARILTVIEQLRADNPDKTVLYFDSGDCEDVTNRLSNLTKGRSMHRLLGLAQPTAAACGNGSLLRYGVEVLGDHAKELGCPLLMANIVMADGSPVVGLQATALVEVGGARLGLIGLNAAWELYVDMFGLQLVDPYSSTHRHATALRSAGADVVIVLSHLGLSEDEFAPGNDRDLAEYLQGVVNIILGAHSHDLLETGEWVGDVLIAQAGKYAEYLGCIEAVWDGGHFQIEAVRVIPITADIMPSPHVLAEEAQIEAEVDEYLGAIIGELSTTLDWSETGECATANLMADALRHRFKADIGVVVAGQAFKGGLEAGPLTRKALWDVSDSTGTPGVMTLTGEQVLMMLRNGLNAERAAERPRTLRGRARGYLHISGAWLDDGKVMVDGRPLEIEREYCVAGSDYELRHQFGYAVEDWKREPTFPTPSVILREVLDEYLQSVDGLITVEGGRLGDLTI